jgi:hypothetical protein
MKHTAHAAYSRARLALPSGGHKTLGMGQQDPAACRGAHQQEYHQNNHSDRDEGSIVGGWSFVFSDVLKQLGKPCNRAPYCGLPQSFKLVCRICRCRESNITSVIGVNLARRFVPFVSNAFDFNTSPVQDPHHQPIHLQTQSPTQTVPTHPILARTHIPTITLLRIENASSISFLASFC